MPYANKADRAASNRRSRYRQFARRPFVAVDGEGWTDETGLHLYTLLGASDGTYVTNPDGLSTVQCADYLLDLAARHPGAVLVGFSFGYDSNMILNGLTWAQAVRLHERGKVWVRTSPRDAYRFEYRPGKWLRISSYRWANDAWKRTRSATVYDVFGFFQSSFVHAMRDMGVIDPTSPEYAELVEMKQKRGTFTDSELERIRAYNQLECDLLVRAMTRLRDGMLAVGIAPSHWYGAGAIATALLRRHGARAHTDCQPSPDATPAVMAAYFGGRIDVHQLGTFAPAWTHDLRSAYPAALASLPSLQGGTWRHVPGRRFGTLHNVTVWRVRWKVPPDAPFGPLPFRTESRTVIFPLRGHGWYWQPEVMAAIDTFGPSAIRVVEGWTCDGIDPNSRPFAWVAELYHERDRLKAEGRDAEQKALKLGLNSLYGKMAQGVGYHAERRPPFQNYVYAGLITAITRARLLRAAMSDPDAVISFATDGISATRPLAVDVGRDLGQWEREQYDSMFICQPGFYWLTRDGVETVRTRGFAPREVDRAAIERAMHDDDWFGRVEMTVTRFVGIGAARVLNRPDAWCSWISMPRVIRWTSEKFNWLQSEWGTLPGPTRCTPHQKPPDGERISTPYVPKGQLDLTLETAMYETERDQPDADIA